MALVLLCIILSRWNKHDNYYNFLYFFKDYETLQLPYKLTV